MRSIAILGAGLAGLSLADALLDEDPACAIVLVDRRRTWERDRTWCTWETGDVRFASLADAHWWEWRTCRDGAVATQRSTRFPYIHIGARALYDVVLDRLDRDPRVVVRTGERVLGIREADGGGDVLTDRGMFSVDRIVDALGPRSPLVIDGPPDPLALAQRFLGWEVQTDAPAFDPGAVTLMDFRAPESGALTFIYVLPFSATHALVEHTTIGPPAAEGPSPERRRELLSGELGERLGIREWVVLHEERGEIPMGGPSHRTGSGPPVLSVGAAAGAVRPSSGYAFSRTQRHVGRLAEALARGARPSEPVGSARLAALDRVFLTALHEQDDHGEELLWALARSVPADPFARFMTDVSSAADELRIIRALPVGTMTATALRLLAGGGEGGLPE